MHPGKLCLALASFTLGLASSALADTITITSTALPTLTLSPSNDTISFNAGSLSTTSLGTITLQSGSFYLGDSPISDQVISFSFNDTITFNGITKTITVFGSDNVTSSADVLDIFAATPVTFGAYTLALNSTSARGTAVGQTLPLTLSANVAAVPTPEPGTAILLGTGLAGGIVMLRRNRAPLAVL